MQQLQAQEIDQRIDTFLTKKHQQFPELGLRPNEREHKAPVVSKLFENLIAGIKWEFGR
ncbi:MAG: hypothetical protein WAR37_02035 [Candidatus Microsaccharimonas sp.]